MTKKLQIFGLFICTQSALHVSGDIFAHHQEHLTVFTAYDTVHYVAAGRCHVFPFVHDTDRQQRRWAISETVNTVKCY